VTNCSGVELTYLDGRRLCLQGGGGTCVCCAETATEAFTSCSELIHILIDCGPLVPEQRREVHPKLFSRTGFLLVSRRFLGSTTDEKPYNLHPSPSTECTTKLGTRHVSISQRKHSDCCQMRCHSAERSRCRSVPRYVGLPVLRKWRE
jgi:hypothetical protein